MKRLRLNLFLALVFIGPAGAPVEAIDSPFGINNDDPAAASTIAYRWIPDAGFGAIRIMANWRNMEPTQGNIIWSDLDARVNEAERQGLDILLSFYFIPVWANGTSPTCGLFFENCSTPPTDPDAFPEFVTAVAQRYKGRISYYGIWNEPDYLPFWGGTRQQFLDLILRPGIQAVRNSDPAAKTVGPDIYTDAGFLQLVLDNFCNETDPNENLDIIAVHSYPSPTTTTTSAEMMLAKMDNDYLPRMVNSSCNKPLWITEYGVNTYSTDPIEQAAFEIIQGEEYVQALQGVLARSAGTSLPRLTRIFLFRLQDNAPPQPYKSGLLRSDDPTEFYEKKPAFFAVESYLRSVFETKIIGVDENLPNFFSLAGSGTISYIPSNSITRLRWAYNEPTCPLSLPCAAIDNKWNAENDTIDGNLPGFNTLTSHIGHENSPGIVVTIDGLSNGAPYDVEVRFGATLGVPGPGIVAGIGASATLVPFGNQTSNHSVLRSWGEWREWSALIPGQRGIVANNKLNLKFDDSTDFDNTVFSGFRVFSPFRLEEGFFSDGFESGNCNGWDEVSPPCL